jgi:homocysteine S-methyltransferase
LIEAARSVTDLPIIAYPNSGEVYDADLHRWVGEPAGAEWLTQATEWFARGARVLGGCCRVGPLTIRRLRAQLERRESRP